jgi:hypothetical protein
MTCFWRGLQAGLDSSRIDDTEFARRLQAANRRTYDVYWNGAPLEKKASDENFEHVRDYDLRHIGDGYDCSTCDPFILLFCQIHSCDVVHDYCGTQITYSNIADSTKTINIISTETHLSFHSVKDKASHL